MRLFGTEPIFLPPLSYAEQLARNLSVRKFDR